MDVASTSGNGDVCAGVFIGGVVGAGDMLVGVAVEVG